MTIMTSNVVRRLYIHFPFCRQRCNYCDFYKEVVSSGINFENFHHYLKSSLPLHQKLMHDTEMEWGKLKSLYIGGGTPSLWEQGPSFLASMLESMQISLDQKCEFTLEMNPGVGNYTTLKTWMDFGLNRVSVGVQSFNEANLKNLGRFHTLADTIQTLQMLKDLKLNYSVDFMIGLPRFSGVSERNIIDELVKVLEFNPSHMSVYILTTGKDYIHAKLIPDDAQIEKEYLLVSDFLKAQGWLHYEISNFARPEFLADHNVAYWNLESVAALGPSATGFMKNGDKCVRYKWRPESVEFVREDLTGNEIRMEEIYLGLRTQKGFSLDVFKENLPHNSVEKLIGIVQGWQKRGLLAHSAPRIVLNSKGMLLLDSLMNELFWVDQLFSIQ